MKKINVSVLLEKSEYEQLKELSIINSRSMASYLRSVIKENHDKITPLEKKYIEKERSI